MARPQLVVMAAGMGSRYGGLKQIEPVGPKGQILTEYALYDAHRAGFERVVFVIRKDIEADFRERIGDIVENHFEVSYAFQGLQDLPEEFSVPEKRFKPWGTGHAVLCAAGCIDAPFAVVNADDFYGQESFRNLFTYLSSAKDADGTYDYCMVGYRLARTLSEHGHVARGICTATQDNHLESIVERTRIRPYKDDARYEADDGHWLDLPGDSIVSMNMFGFTPSFMDELKAHFPVFLKENLSDLKAEFFLPTVVNQLIEEKKAQVTILPTHDRWIGVTYREDTPVVREAIHSYVDRGKYPVRLWD